MQGGKLTDDERLRYSRHLTLPGFDEAHQLRLKAAKVLVVGAGGLGCPVLQYLAASGVGHMTVLDGDTVSGTNLHRQILFDPTDIGQNKALVAQKRLGQQFPDCHIVGEALHLNRDNALEWVERHDIVVDGSDNFPTRYLVNDACVIAGKPLVYGAVNRWEGQVSLFNATAESPNYRDIFPEMPDEGEVPNCAEGGVLGIMPGLIGMLQATEAVKCITGLGDSLSGRLLTVDGQSTAFYELRIKANPVNRVSELGQYEWNCAPEEQAWTVDSATLSSWLESADKPQLVDVRELDEHEEYNIGGHLIPSGQLAERQAELNKTERVVLYCQSGQRSTQALALLRKKGFEQVFHLQGGMNAWKRLNLASG